LIPPQFGDAMGPEGDEIRGYPVYLNGELQAVSWQSYFLYTLLYKVPEGTWLLFALSVGVIMLSPRSRAPWRDELSVLLVPIVLLAVMSFGTNINLGLRYVLPIFPYGFISIGKVVPWSVGYVGRARRAAMAAVGACMALTVAATALIHPHFLAYFNWISGGPRHGSEHLIDSNLDWGQDLVNLRVWLAANAPNEPVGLAYFGQIPPTIFAKRQEPFPWFLPPILPASVDDPSKVPLRYRRVWQRSAPPPGLYAVSASLVRGLPWRVYDCISPSADLDDVRYWAPYEAQWGAFSYFAELEPIDVIGYSIFIYRVSPDQARHLARHWERDSK
jgi:hypothetical protein